jgi:hypothetical protein
MGSVETQSVLSWGVTGPMARNERFLRANASWRPRTRISLFAKFSCLGVEIGVPCIERLILRCEIALEFWFTFGNDAPATRIFVKKDSRYLCAVTIAQNGFRGHQRVSFLLARILAEKHLSMIHKLNLKKRRVEERAPRAIKASLLGSGTRFTPEKSSE